jgi:hypothetical protein
MSLVGNDPTYYVLCVLAWLGVAWDVRVPPPALIKGVCRLGRTVIDKVAAQLAPSFPINHITSRVHEELAHTPGWMEVKLRIASAHSQAETFWSETFLNATDLPELPSLDEVRRHAAQRLARTPSLEEIAVRARQRLLELIYARLSETAAASP